MKKYKHRWTKGLKCELVNIQKNGKQIIYTACIGDMKFSSNKDKFAEDWIEIKT